MARKPKALCGVKLGECECALAAKHDGMHQGLLGVGDGVAEILWAPTYGGLAENPHLAHLKLEDDEAPVIELPAIYAAENLDWFVN